MLLFHLGHESAYRDCPDCRELQKHVEANQPYTREAARLALIGPIVGLGLIHLGILWIWGTPNSIMGGGTAALGVATLIVSAIVALVLYRTVYHRHNVKGYSVFATMFNGGQIHVHLSSRGLFDNNVLVGLEIPITGRRQPCGMWHPTHPLDVICDRSERLVLTSGDDELKTASIRTALLFISERRSIADMAAHNLDFDRQVMIELRVLERITGREDPLWHGHSKHGQILHERVDKLLGSLDNRTRDYADSWGVAQATVEELKKSYRSSA